MPSGWIPPNSRAMPHAMPNSTKHRYSRGGDKGKAMAWTRVVGWGVVHDTPFAPPFALLCCVVRALPFVLTCGYHPCYTCVE